MVQPPGTQTVATPMVCFSHVPRCQHVVGHPTVFLLGVRNEKPLDSFISDPNSPERRETRYHHRPAVTAVPRLVLLYQLHRSGWLKAVEYGQAIATAIVGNTRVTDDRHRFGDHHRTPGPSVIRVAGEIRRPIRNVDDAGNRDP